MVSNSLKLKLCLFPSFSDPQHRKNFCFLMWNEKREEIKRSKFGIKLQYSSVTVVKGTVNRLTDLIIFEKLF